MKAEKSVDLDELLRRSAQEVRAALPALVQEREDLTKRIIELNQKIGAASALISAFGQQPRPPTQQPADSHSKVVKLIPPASPVTHPGRAKHGMVYKHVQEVLRPGIGRKVPDLSAIIEKLYGVKYSQSSLYRALVKGQKGGLYQSKDGTWSATAKGKSA